MSALPEPRDHTPGRGRGRALVLGGGGLLGAMYEIGCLAALERAAPRGMPGFDLYVGTSAGAVVASLLAAGYTASDLLDSVESFSPGNLCRLDLNALLRASVRLPYRWARGTLAGLFRRPSPVVGALSLLQEAVPAGLLSLAPLAGFIRERLRAKGLEDAFEALPRRLHIPAIDLDTGERVVFGGPQHARASVSVAVAASCAIPRFFQPVSSGGRDFVDGGIADALNLDVALSWGAREALVVNPMVAPLNDRNSRCLPSPNGGCGHVAEQGLVATLAQAIKISHMIHSATSFHLHRLTHPEVRIEVIQPDRLEADLDSPMDFRGRDRVLALGKSDGIRAAQYDPASVLPANELPNQGGVACTVEPGSGAPCPRGS